MVKKKKRNRAEGYVPSGAYVQYLLLRLLDALNRVLPDAVTAWIAAGVGECLFYILPKRRKIALANLDIAYGGSKSDAEKKIIARKSFAHVALSILEFFSIAQFLKHARERVRFSGLEVLDRAFARGKGVILVISHLGSWEYLALLPYLKGYPCSVIGKPTRNPYLYKWIRDLRSQSGLVHIDKNEAAKKSLGELRKNHLVAILIDQWAGDEGIISEFFGVLSSSTSIPARFARKTGSALVPAYCVRLARGRYEIQIKPEIVITGEETGDWEKRTTDALNRQLEDQIQRYPEQWTWGHRRWKNLDNRLAVSNEKTGVE